MADRDVPPGWSHNPSRFSRRLPVLVLALAACGLATYLTLYQVGAVADVWEPCFGNGSKRVLKESAIARYLPIPDASLGALAYLVEAVLEAAGGDDRWRRRPGIVLLLGLTAAGIAVGSALLVITQAVFVRAFCTLCLVSAACSFVIAAAVVEEVRAAWQQWKRATAGGRSAWHALWGPDQQAVAGSGPAR